MPFYKKDGDSLFSAQTVHGPNDFALTTAEKDSLSYPQQGWYWFDTLEDALLGMLNAPQSGAKKITRLAFRNRFTQAEKAAIEIAQLDDPSATMPQRYQAAALRASQADVSSSTYIDLDRADTIAGVQQLEAIGLIGSGRSDQILGAAIQPEELYRG